MIHRISIEMEGSDKIKKYLAPLILAATTAAIQKRMVKIIAPSIMIGVVKTPLGGESPYGPDEASLDEDCAYSTHDRTDRHEISTRSVSTITIPNDTDDDDDEDNCSLESYQ